MQPPGQQEERRQDEAHYRAEAGGRHRVRSADRFVAVNASEGTQRPARGEATVQYEHTLVATRNGPLVLTLA